MSGSERRLRHQRRRVVREGVLGIGENGTHVARAGGNRDGEGGGKGRVVGDRDLAIVEHPHVEVVQIQSGVGDGNHRLASGKVDGKREVVGDLIGCLSIAVEGERTVALNHGKQGHGHRVGIVLHGSARLQSIQTNKENVRITELFGDRKHVRCYR